MRYAGSSLYEWGEMPPPSPARLRAETNFALRNPGFVTTVGRTGGTRENELVLWNYMVGSSRTRPEHNATLARAAPNWRRELRVDPLRRIKIIGSASLSSGDTAQNERVARARADNIRAILTNVYGIPRGRIETASEGNRIPLADEMAPDDPLNMARDRRVEIFLFLPTRLAARIDGVSVPFSSLESNLDSGPETRVRVETGARNFAERHFGVAADGRASWTGPPDSSIGFIQLLTNDTRRGFYSGRSGRKLMLDFARCTSPFLPCRDMADAADGLSEPGKAGTGRAVRVRVPFLDRPGNFVPLHINDPIAGPADLVRTHWLMVFVLLFGVRRGELFLPLHHLTWEVLSARTFPGAIATVGPVTRRIASGPGAPVGLAFDAAMLGGTCRLRTRSIDRSRLRAPDDECPEIPQGRACPPLVCSARVTRF